MAKGKGEPRPAMPPKPTVFWPPLRDDEGYDEIRVQKVPRYKASSLSGACWRTSVRVQLVSKARVLIERDYRDIRTALMFLPGLFLTAADLEDFKRPTEEEDNSLCFQPGCMAGFVSEYRVLKNFTKEGHGIPDPPDSERPDRRRRFCPQHLQRGTCDLDDNDKNYEVLSGPGPEKAAGWDRSAVRSGFGGIVPPEAKPEGRGDRE